MEERGRVDGRWTDHRLALARLIDRTTCLETHVRPARQSLMGVFFVQTRGLKIAEERSSACCSVGRKKKAGDGGQWTGKGLGERWIVVSDSDQDSHYIPFLWHSVSCCSRFLLGYGFFYYCSGCSFSMGLLSRWVFLSRSHMSSLALFPAVAVLGHYWPWCVMNGCSRARAWSARAY